jgi:glycosyltransferase involved in cell wall biosynthesis
VRRTTEESLPLVTLVTPAYNQAEYLAETIESVLAQDYPNLEYIVLDDGSTDDTPGVLERYRGRVRWERHDNMGQSRTLNKGWSMARGDLLGYLSSDDRLRKNCISRLVAAMQTEEKAVVAYCDFTHIDAAGRRIRDVTTSPYSRYGLVGDLICYPGPGVLFRREVFAATGGWNPRLRQVPDFDFWLRASDLGPFLRVDASLAEYRIHPMSASFRKIDEARSDEIIEVVADYWRKQTDRLERRSRGTSYVFSACNHLISGRYATALRRVADSLRYQPLRTLAPKNVRMLLFAFVRQFYYEKLLGLFRASATGTRARSGPTGAQSAR